MSGWGKVLGNWLFLIVGITITVIMMGQRLFRPATAPGSTAPPLRIAMSGVYPPFNYFNKRNKLVGFDVDIAREIARRLQRHPELITTAWDGILTGLLTKKYDCIIGSMAITEERKKSVSFSDPYYVSGAQLIVLKGSPIVGVNDLKGNTVGVTIGETYEEYVRNVAGIKRVATYDGGPPLLVLELKHKRIDAFVSDRLVGLYAGRESAVELALAGDLLYREEMGIAIHRDDTELLASVNRALAAMRADGTYTEISTAWFGRDIMAGE